MDMEDKLIELLTNRLTHGFDRIYRMLIWVMIFLGIIAVILLAFLIRLVSCS